MATVRVFNYVEELDAFLVTEEYLSLAERLGLNEWTPVVWICRLFMLDNDYGEHLFDNWEERDDLEEKAVALGINTYDLMIVTPNRLADNEDGPCHSTAIRKLFWTDVLKSLELSYELLFEEARFLKFNKNKAHTQMRPPTEINPEIEEIISEIRAEVAAKSQ